MKKGTALHILLLLISLFGLSGILKGQKDTTISFQSREHIINTRIDSIISFSKTLTGKPYLWKTSDNVTLDCSGFIYHVFNHAGINLHRNSESLANQAKKIAYKNIRRGDLLFFKDRDQHPNKIGHVSLVTNRAEDTIKMIHSTRRGIRTDLLSMDYYHKRFLYAARIPELYKIDSLAKDSSKFVKDSFPQDKDSVEVAELKKKDTITILGVGDMMLGTNFPNNSYLPPNDGKDLFLPVKDILTSADITFGNLEGVLLTAKGSVKKCGNPDNCYAFKSPDHYVHNFVDAGFDVLSIANNHIRDFGSIGWKNTMELLTENNINYAGLEQKPYDIFTKDSVIYGFCAFSPNTGTVRINNVSKIKEIVRHLDTLTDIVIVSFHGGAEGIEYQHITRKTEYYLGENRGNPYTFARQAIDAGADVIFGHGPHVTRAIDIYKNRFIAYSMGNFATYARFSLRGPKGVAPMIKVRTKPNGEFINATIFSTYQSGRGGPKPDSNNRALKQIMELTQKDIPECKLKILENGNVILKPE